MLYLHPEYVDLTKTECIRMPEEYTKYPDIITYTEFRDKGAERHPSGCNDWKQGKKVRLLSGNAWIRLPPL